MEEKLLFAAGVALITVLVAYTADYARPAGAWIGDSGDNGEDTLLFDPKSAPAKS